jgi:NAD(P)-dependent dehydrogenase (short-subunit alcohol dehydrogenase family)
MKNILITGASGNLGKACVEKFIGEGYHVICTVSPGKTLGYKVNGTVEIHEADLTNEDHSLKTINTVVAKHNTLDAALLLVGGFAMGDVQKTSTADITKMLSLNFDTAYNIARPVFLHMLTQATGGRIIFIGARPALNLKSGKNTLAYTLSKSLVFNLAEILNAEGSSKNVVSSVVVPSTIDTPVNRAAMPDADFLTWVKPEEIAETIAFLISEKGSALRDGVVEVYGRA